MRKTIFLLFSLGLATTTFSSEPLGERHPLGPELRVLAEDVESPNYRRLVTEQMLSTDLDAEWQRVETADNPESFLKKHGGREKVLAETGLKAAYERRLAIRRRFLDLMREAFRRHKKPAPFDRGEKAPAAGTYRGPLTAEAQRLAPVLPAPDAERYWPRFRGPSGQGLTNEVALPVRWDQQGTNLRWRRPIPGHGNSSPILWGDRIFLTSAPKDGAQRSLHCLRRTDGELLWSRTLEPKTTEEGIAFKNTYASSTPVTDGRRVIAFLGSCGLVCFDFEGTLLWRHDDLIVGTSHGPGSSPVLYRDKVILIQDQNRNDSIFLALDKRTGKLLWKHTRPRAMTWCTPVVVRVDDHDELIFAGGETVKGYDPETGRELWTLSGPTREVVPTIVVGDHYLYSASGRSGPTLALIPGGSGDVTESHLAWRAVRGGPHVPSPIYLDGRLYTVNDTGIATCLDAETGKLVWQARIRDRFSASPIAVGDLLYFSSESGVTYVLRAGDRFEIVAENDLGSPILGSPAVHDGTMYLRTANELVAIGPVESAGTSN